jgi:nucleotide-binding universal stress UspA family protein
VLAEPLARSAPAHELIIARPVRPSRTVGAGVRGGLQTESLALERSSRIIDDVRARLADEQTAARGVAFTTANLSGDLLDIVDHEAVDLVLVEGRRRLIGEGVPLGEVADVLERAPSDVAVLIAREDSEIRLGPDRPVLVPFGGAEHDWSALELGSWLAASTGAPLKLLGAGGQTDESGSVTRMLADAGLLVQQNTGVATEPLVVAGGRDGILAAAGDAGLLVIGLSERWRREGLGPTRSEIAKAAPAPVLFVRRGQRPGLFSPPENATQFKWSMAGAPMSGILPGLAPHRAHNGADVQRNPEEDTPPVSLN